MKMRNATMKTFIFLLILLPFTIYHLPSPVSAQEKQTQILRVSPVIINVNLSPSKSYTHEITLENLLDAPLPVRAVFSDFEAATEDGGYVFQDTRTNPLLSWTQLSEQEIILPAKAKRTIRLTINTPQRIAFGGYYGILFFEPVFPKTPTAAEVATRVGVLLLADIGSPDPNAEKADILDFSLDKLIEPGQAAPFLLRVKNTSLNFFTAKPILTLTPLVGEAKKTVLEEKVVFPGKVRRWEEEIMLPTETIGIYSVTMAVSTGEGRQVMENTIVVIFPYRVVLLLLGVSAIAAFGLLRRKQLRKALHVLLTDRK